MEADFVIVRKFVWEPKRPWRTTRFRGEQFFASLQAEWKLKSSAGGEVNVDRGMREEEGEEEVEEKS